VVSTHWIIPPGLIWSTFWDAPAGHSEKNELFQVLMAILHSLSHHSMLLRCLKVFHKQRWLMDVAVTVVSSA